MRAVTVAAALVFAGCLGNGPDAPAEPADASTVWMETVSRGAELVGSKRFFFDVPLGTLAISAKLNWSTGAKLALTIVAPDNSSFERAGNERSGRLSLVTATPPVPGTWDARVTMTTPGDTPFELTVTNHVGPPKRERIFAVVDIERGRFVEANVVLAEGETVQWKFDATAPVAWDIHTHDGTAVQTPQKGSGVTHSGPFTAARAGLHSFYWEAKESPARVTYSVEGVMRVHSYAQA